MTIHQDCFKDALQPGQKVEVPDGREGKVTFYAPWNKSANYLVVFQYTEWFSRDEVTAVK